MADVRSDPRGQVDPAINSPGREGLTGTAPANLYAPGFEREQIEQLRPLSTPVNTFQFGRQTITTQVHVMVPRKLASAAPYVDVTAAMDEQPRNRAVSLKVVTAPDAAPVESDPFAEVEV